MKSAEEWVRTVLPRLANGKDLWEILGLIEHASGRSYSPGTLDQALRALVKEGVLKTEARRFYWPTGFKGPSR